MSCTKIILAGGTGFLGRVLTDHWKTSPYELVVLTRHPKPAVDNVRYVVWDGKTAGSWVAEIDGAAAIINLAGRSVDCRYTKKNKHDILTSRTDSTAALGQAIRCAANPPGVWINAASATIYRHSVDKPMDEETGDIEKDFSVQVCKAWEQSFWQADTPSTRKVCLRVAMVLGRSGGVFPVLSRLVKAGLGGTMGRGDQFISWLHERDFARILDYALENEQISGTYNASAPNPMRNRLFMKLLRWVYGVPFGVAATEWMLHLGAFVLRTETDLVLKSRNVVPARLLQHGFLFEFPDVEMAVADLTEPSLPVVSEVMA